MNRYSPSKTFITALAVLGALLFAADEVAANTVVFQSAVASSNITVSFEESVFDKCEDLGPLPNPMVVNTRAFASTRYDTFDHLAVCVLSGEEVGRRLIIAPGSVHPKDEALATSMAKEMHSLGLEDKHYEVVATSQVIPAAAVRTSNATRNIVLRILDEDDPAGEGQVIVAMGDRLMDYCKLKTFSVFFDTGGVALRRDARRSLNRVAACIRSGEIDAKGFIIKGHASPLGDAQANRVLSETRAMNVAVYLIGTGIPESTLEIRALGESNERGYLAPSAERRVDIIVSEN